MSAIRAFEVRNKILPVRWGTALPDQRCLDEHTGGQLPPGPCPLKKRIKKHKNTGGDDPLEKSNAKMGQCQCSFDPEV